MIRTSIPADLVDTYWYRATPESVAQWFPPSHQLSYTPPAKRAGRRCRWCSDREDDECLKDTIIEPEFHYFHDLCDRCHLSMSDPNPVEVTVSFHRGCTFWSFGGFEGLQGMTMLCVSNAPEHAWRKRGGDYDEVNNYETWLYFRTRAEWLAAWRIARYLITNDNQFGTGFNPAIGIMFNVPWRVARDLRLIAGWKLRGTQEFRSLSEDQP